MFGLFGSKSAEKSLQKKYEKILKKAYERSKVSRQESDTLYAEAQAVLEELEALRANQ